MMRRALLALILLAIAAPLFALGIPPKPTAWVTDDGNLLGSDHVATLNQKCEDFYQASKAELLVMTFPSLQGEDPVDYTNRVLNHWKTKDGRDRIAIIFIFAKERQLRIQVGYGLEGELTDTFTGDVYRNTLVPAFRSGDYYSGINTAIDRLAKQVDPNWTPPGASTSTSTSTSPAGMPRQLPPRTPPPDRSGGQIGIGDILPELIFLFVVFLFILPLLRRRSGCGGCVGCLPMFPFGGGWGGGGGTTFGGGGGGGGGGWSVGSNWGSGGGSSFGGGGAGGGW
jgi:uncharacterized protein